MGSSVFPCAQLAEDTHSENSGRLTWFVCRILVDFWDWDRWIHNYLVTPRVSISSEPRAYRDYNSLAAVLSYDGEQMESDEIWLKNTQTRRG